MFFVVFKSKSNIHEHGVFKEVCFYATCIAKHNWLANKIAPPPISRHWLSQLLLCWAGRDAQTNSAMF